MATRNVYGPHDVLARPHHHDAGGFDLVDAGVGGVQQTAGGVETDITVEGGLKVSLERFCHAGSIRDWSAVDRDLVGVGRAANAVRAVSVVGTSRPQPAPRRATRGGR